MSLSEDIKKAKASGLYPALLDDVEVKLELLKKSLLGLIQHSTFDFMDKIRDLHFYEVLKYRQIKDFYDSETFYKNIMECESFYDEFRKELSDSEQESLKILRLVYNV